MMVVTIARSQRHHSPSISLYPKPSRWQTSIDRKHCAASRRRTCGNLTESPTFLIQAERGLVRVLANHSEVSERERLGHPRMPQMEVQQTGLRPLE